MTRLRRFLLGVVGTALVLVASYIVWVVGLLRMMPKMEGWQPQTRRSSTTAPSK